jgi:hypothetical protein
LKPHPALLNQLTAAVLAVVMTALGWFLRSETAHDFLHFHPSAVQLARAGQAQLERAGKAVVTQTPRWLKVAAAPADAPAPTPAGPHRHRSLAFDSLAAGQWCGLFTPAALPTLDLPALAAAVPQRPVALPRVHWRFLPGRAPPAAV